MEDKIIKCKDCGEAFVFTVNDQKFYKEVGYDAPKRCKVCRIRRKEQRKNEQ